MLDDVSPATPSRDAAGSAATDAAAAARRPSAFAEYVQPEIEGL